NPQSVMRRLVALSRTTLSTSSGPSAVSASIACRSPYRGACSGTRSRDGAGDGLAGSGGACGVNAGIGISRSPTRSISPILIAYLLSLHVDADLWIFLHQRQRRLGVGRHQLAYDDPLGTPAFGAEDIAAKAFDDAVYIAMTDVRHRRIGQSPVARQSASV